MDNALDLFVAEEAADDWLLRNREAINQRLDESCAQAERGEGFTEQQLRARMAERRATQPHPRAVS